MRKMRGGLLALVLAVLALLAVPLVARADESMVGPETTDVQTIAPQSTGLIDGQVVPQDGARYSVLVLDTSDSMSGERIERLKKAADKFCNEVTVPTGENYTALVTFKGTASQLSEFTNDYDKLKLVIPSINASGSTDTTGGMQVAHELLQMAPESATKNIVIFSDGEPNSASSAQKLFAEISPLYHIYTLGFFQGTSTSGEAFLRSIQNSGYWNVQSLDDLEFQFGDVADQISGGDLRKTFVNQHLSFYRGNDYKKLVTSESGEFFDEAMQTLNGDTALRGYNFVKKTADELKFKMDEDSEYELILAQLLMSEQSTDGLKDSFEVSLKEAFDHLDQVLADAMAQSDDPAMQEAAETIKSIYKYMGKDIDDPEAYWDTQEKIQDVLEKAATADDIVKLLGEDTSPVGDVLDVLITLLDLHGNPTKEALRQIGIAMAYMNASDDFITVLNRMEQEATVENILGSGISGQRPTMISTGENEVHELRGALITFSNNLERTRENEAIELAHNLKGLNLSKDYEIFNTTAADVVLEGKLGIATAIADAGLSFGNLFYGLDDRGLSGTMMSKYYYMDALLDNVADSFGEDLVRASSTIDGDMTESFRVAAAFDESVNLYKASRLLSYDYADEYIKTLHNVEAEEYEQLKNSASGGLYGIYRFVRLEELTTEHSFFEVMLPLERNSYDAMRCHSKGLLYDHVKKELAFDQTDLQVINIACPVDVTVKDDSGATFATIRGTVVQTREGYEHYFRSTPSSVSSGTVKVLVIPRSYTLDLTGSGSGTMNIIVRNYKSGVPDGEVQAFRQIPVTSQTEGSLVESSASRTKRDLVLDDNRYKYFDADNVTGIRLSASSLQLKKGETKSLMCTLQPSGISGYNVDWKSSDESVATVDQSGRITAKGAGTATITVGLQDANVTASCKVTVESDGQPIYRLYNQWSAEHLYTADRNEYEELAAKGWSKEGIAWYAPTTSSKPVYRLFNPYNGDHHYTMSIDEYISLGGYGWRREGIKTYSAEPSSGKPIYVLFNPYTTTSTHLYTASYDEYQRCRSAGWQGQGPGWYSLAS